MSGIVTVETLESKLCFLNLGATTKLQPLDELYWLLNVDIV